MRRRRVERHEAGPMRQFQACNAFALRLHRSRQFEEQELPFLDLQKRHDIAVAIFPRPMDPDGADPRFDANRREIPVAEAHPAQTVDFDLHLDEERFGPGTQDEQIGVGGERSSVGLSPNRSSRESQRPCGERRQTTRLQRAGPS